MTFFLLSVLITVWAAACFGVFFYFMWPRLIQRERHASGKLMVAKGLSSFWLVWPGLFALIIIVSYWTESITLLSIFLLIASMGMGTRETQRILKASGVDWAPFTIKTVDGKDILGS